ncbi:MAG TPA: sugar phosphate nucleotidyltransferase [Acidimicrobiales bacterium]|nr:sugar phosphate nucleotidyltransferase [Acidimicrobiales bacterium]
MLPVVVLAGGLGTRVETLTGGVLPKALLPVAGRPFVDHKLEQLRHEGVSSVVLLVGHRAQPIVEHVGDGSRYGMAVRCVEDGPVLLGTGGAVRAALDSLPDAFWVTYGDTLLDAPMEDIEARFLADDVDGLMTVLHNRDRWQPSNVTIDGKRVVAYSKGDPPGTHEHIDYGLLLFRRDVFAALPEGRPFDLADALRPLVSARRLGAYVVTTRFRDIGTVEALAETEAELRRRPAT